MAMATVIGFPWKSPPDLLPQCERFIASDKAWKKHKWRTMAGINDGHNIPPLAIVRHVYVKKPHQYLRGGLGHGGVVAVRKHQAAGGQEPHVGVGGQRGLEQEE
jgi:hypothetical protein